MVSENDCYVTLTLPPATVFKTNTVVNSRNPEWNQSFDFKLFGSLKCTLQIRLCDEDIRFDEVIQTIKFDISTLAVGKKDIKEFPIHPQGKLWIAFELQQSIREAASPLQAANPVKEVISYWKLNVTVVAAKIHTSNDYLSDSDCYVSLSLPTAAASEYKTTTINNNLNPKWNETFSFRVPSHLKSILEIKLHDQDSFLSNDLISTVLFDLSNLQAGKKEAMSFTLNPETKDRILMQFEKIHSEDPPCDYVSNGVLLAAPFSVLDIKVDKLLNNYDFLGKALTLKGAHPGHQSLLAKEMTKLRFYINRDLDTELGVASSADALNTVESSTRLQALPAEHAGNVSLVIDHDTVELNVETHESLDNLAVRLDFDIPQQEKEYLKKRKTIVGQNMQHIFGLDSPPPPNKVPTIALVGSGGGSRAMTGLLGCLKSLKNLNVLDSVTYITGVSGSTWAMSALYQDANWSHDGIDSTIAEIKKEITKDFLSVFTPEKMQYYSQEMEDKIKNGHNASQTDMPGLIYEQIVFGKKMTSTLAEQQKAVNEGQNPLPVYTAVNIKDKIGCESENEWCEFTPYEVGFQKYGAFVKAEDFGSQFFLGHLIKKLPEVYISYLIGIWSSFFSVNMTELLMHSTDYELNWDAGFEPDVTDLETDSEASTLCTRHVEPSTLVSGIISDFLRNRPIVSTVYNFLHGLFLHSNYNKHANFKAWKETHPDAFPNTLTPHDSNLHLIDSGLSINVGFAPILRPEREVDIIICLDCSWNPGNMFKEVKRTAAYCEDHDIAFPHIDFASLEAEPPREVYIFEDEKNLKAPLVILFPLVNISFKDFKQPGVRRETEEEIKAGQVDISTANSPFATKHIVYSEEDFDSLLKLAAYNVSNNKTSILETLDKVLKAKMASQGACLR
ncbi:cytosolic phospholipase A2 beta-like [Entelurus aequoreus]|uniref:cytosolic phospholipase A2 beta-like n=1 Tax=Entelurus aequoreus TaxID=161455 RepID=UPI002B1E6D6C|nr:cytosolic phospholipase A2 beta-like [Entelurus aequoreus]